MTSSTQERYCLDTNTWIYLWRYYYPIDIFPSVWEKIEEAIENSIVRSPMEVYYELESGKDALFEWLKKRKEAFYALDSSQQQHVIKIMEKFPNFVDTEKSLTDADPFVIAMAIDQELSVVTMEKFKNIQDNDRIAKPKIPNVCQHFSVPFINNIPVFLRELGWIF